MKTTARPSLTAENGGLSVRLDALVSQTEVVEPPRAPAGLGLDLSATLTWLRSDIGGMRADLDALRAEVAGAQAWVVARAGEAEPTADTSALESVIDDRLAALEDALGGMAERFESLSRDSAGDTVERIATLDRKVEALGGRLAALGEDLVADRGESEVQRARDAQTLAEHSGVVAGMAVTTRAGLDDLGTAVASGLDSFSAAMGEARQADRESERRYLETLLASFTQVLQGGFQSMREEVSAELAPLDARIDALTVLVRDGFGTMREGLLAEVGGAIGRLERENGVVRTTVEAGLAELRGDLADALDEVRDGVESTVGGAREAITGTLREHQATSLDLRDGVAAATGQLRDEVSAQLAEIGDVSTTNAHQLGAEMSAVTSEVRDSIRTALDHAERSDEATAALQAAVTRLDSTLETLAGDWQPQIDAIVAQGRAAAQSVLEQVQVEVDDAIKEMNTALQAQVATIRQVTGGIDGGTSRLVDAGEALLGYLAERDRELERERDRMLHDVLDEFAQGLSAKQRRAAAGKLGEALERRRDVRDAERFRRSDAQRDTSVVSVPTEIAALNDPPPAPPAADLPASDPPTADPPDTVADSPTEDVPDAIDTADLDLGPLDGGGAAPRATSRLRTTSTSPAGEGDPAGVPVKRAARRRPTPAETPVTATKTPDRAVAKKTVSTSSPAPRSSAKTAATAPRSAAKRGAGSSKTR